MKLLFILLLISFSNLALSQIVKNSDDNFINLTNDKKDDKKSFNNFENDKVIDKKDDETKKMNQSRLASLKHHLWVLLVLKQV